MAKEKTSVEKESRDVWALKQCINTLDQLEIAVRAQVVMYLHTKYLNEAMEAIKKVKRAPIIPVSTNGNDE